MDNNKDTSHSTDEPTSGDTHDQPEPETIDSPKSPATEDALAEALKALHEAQKALDSCPPDDPNRIEKLDGLACAIADYHVNSNVDGEGRLPEAIVLVKEGLEHARDDHPRRGSALNTLANIHIRLYNSTRNSDYLVESIEWGWKAAGTTTDQLPEGLQTELTCMRANNLAMRLQMKFEHPQIGGDMKDLDSAMAWQAKSADNSPPHSREGMTRFGRFCELLVLKASIADDIRLLHGAIELRKKQLNCGSPFAPENILGLSNLLCRRYGWTKKPEDLEELLEIGKPMVVEEERGSRLQVLKTCASIFKQCLAMRDRPDLHGLEAGRAVYEALLDMSPMETLKDLEFRIGPVTDIGELLWDLYKLTDDARHGWAYDDMNMQNAKTCVMMKMLRVKEDQTVASMGGVRSVSVGDSCVLKRQITHPGSKIDHVDLLFLGDVSAETYIRKRNDDGTVELGVTDADFEAIEYLRDL